MSKRGQVTIFIIVGVVILLVFGLVYFFVIQTEEDKAEAAKEEAQEVIVAFLPVRNFVEECILITAENALIRLGQQGGYIEPQYWGGLYFSFADPTDSDGISFSPDGGLNIPYWHFNKRANAEYVLEFDSNTPSIEDMESDVERFIRVNLQDCFVSGFREFKQQQITITEEEEMDVDVQIVPGKVRVGVTHPINMRRGDTEEYMESFYQEVNLDLLKIYNLALEITETQRNSSFLEKAGLNMLEVHSGIDREKLPPMTDSSFEFVPTVFWSVAEVKEKLKEVLAGTVSYIRYHNSRNFFNYEFGDVAYKESKQRAYNNLVIPLDGADGIDVRFDYLPWWEPYLFTNADGDMIMPESLSIAFVFVLGVQRYRTVYDLSYPVFVSLTLPDALNGQDYQFNFGLESNIRDNKPGSELEGGLVSPVIRFDEPSLFCNLGQRNTGEIKVIVRDKFTKKRIEGAGISFRALGDTCTIGRTDKTGFWNGSFPVAIGGELMIVHPDYLIKAVPFDTYFEEDGEIVVELWRYKEINVSVRKKKIAKCADSGCHVSNKNEEEDRGPFSILEELFGGGEEEGDSGRGEWKLQNMPFKFGEDEQAVVMLERVGEEGEAEVFAGAEINEDKEVDFARLVPGYYRVTITNILNREILIPEEERMVGGVSYDLPEVRLDPFQSGGVLWREPEDYYYLSPAKLYGGREIQFYSLYYALPEVPLSLRTVEDLTTVMNYTKDSVKFRGRLEPSVR